MFREVKKDETFRKIEVTLFSNAEAFKKAVENEAYVTGEPQATELAWAASATGFEENEADSEKFSFTTVKK